MPVSLESEVPSISELKLARSALPHLSAALSTLNSRSEVSIRVGNSPPIAVPAIAIQRFADVLSELAVGRSQDGIEAFVSLKEAAEFLDAPEARIAVLAESGELPSELIDGTRRIQLQGLLDYDQRRTDRRLKALEALAADAQDLKLGY